MDTLLIERNNRVCSYCKYERSVESFPWRNKARGERDGRCIQCKAAWRAEHYSLHADEIAAKNRRLESERQKQSRQIIDLAKSKPCLDCGGSFPICAMDFDHVDGTKVGNISYMAWHNSISALLAEIAKCEVVCANCHRVRTFERLGA